MVSSSPQEDAGSPTERVPPASAPLQVQSNANSNFDAFTASTPRNDSNAYGNSALWEKFNGTTVGAQPPAVYEGIETPGSQGNESDDVRVTNGASMAETPMEPPLAPTRKNRAAHAMGADNGMDPPPKMKPTGIRPKARTRPDQEESMMPGQLEREQSVAASRIGDRKRTVSGQVAHSSISQSTEPGAPQRRSVRLFNQIKPTSSKFSGSSLATKESRELKRARATGTKGRTTNNVGRVVSGNRKPMIVEGQDSDSKELRPVSQSTSQTGSTRSSTSEKSREIEALGWLLELFSKLASGFFALNRYRCPESIQIFNSLSQAQRETPWVLAQLGRAYYEQAMYSEAEKYFFHVKTMAPSRLDDMEIYSTVLWHLKNDVELAYLAHELMEVERLSPQAWCAVGNSFSHQRDHDQAVKCFKRATQLDPHFAYAFTLQGHEYVANEEYDKALESYRHGISADNRHYNAWYGLGTVYDKMGKLDFAEQHFRNAASINPTNAVLICCVGLVQEKMNNPKAALIQYSRACSLAPHSVLARFRKARVLMKLQELKLALAELKILKDMAPDEANVHYLLGKLYKMLHDKAHAIKHFTTALNLDPKVCFFHLIIALFVVVLTFFLRPRSTSRMLWSRWRKMKRKMRIWLKPYTSPLHSIKSYPSPHVFFSRLFSVRMPYFGLCSTAFYGYRFGAIISIDRGVYQATWIEECVRSVCMEFPRNILEVCLFYCFCILALVHDSLSRGLTPMAAAYEIRTAVLMDIPLVKEIRLLLLSLNQKVMYMHSATNRRFLSKFILIK